MERISPPHNGPPMKASQPRLIKPVPSHEMNNRSPLVVSRPSIPRLWLPPGLKRSQTPMTIIENTTTMKKAAVGQVQAIHDKPIKFFLPVYTRPRANPLAI